MPPKRVPTTQRKSPGAGKTPSKKHTSRTVSVDVGSPKPKVTASKKNPVHRKTEKEKSGKKAGWIGEEMDRQASALRDQMKEELAIDIIRIIGVETKMISKESNKPRYFVNIESMKNKEEELIKLLGKISFAFLSTQRQALYKTDRKERVQSAEYGPTICKLVLKHVLNIESSTHTTHKAHLYEIPVHKFTERQLNCFTEAMKQALVVEVKDNFMRSPYA